MNSFGFLEKGIRAEIERQTRLLRGGEQVEQETLHFDPASGAITSLRSKEEAHDYRYFPEPDLVPIAITAAMLGAAREAMPELPAARAQRYETELGLSPVSAQALAEHGELAAYFERVLAAAPAGGGEPAPAQAIAQWVIAELAPRLDDTAPADTPATPAAFAALVAMVARRELNVGSARTVLERLMADGGEPGEIVAAEGLSAVGGADELAPIVAAAIAANPGAADKVRAGKVEAIGPIVGFVMRETRGRADGGEARRLVLQQLGA